MTASCVKVPAQSASHRYLTPIKVWQKPGIRCPLNINSIEKWGKAKFPSPAVCFVCPVAVPTMTLDAERYMLTAWSSATNYLSVALEFTISV